MTFKLKTNDPSSWLKHLYEKIRQEGIDPMDLMENGEVPVFEKYDDCIPVDLLRRSYATDRLRTDEFIRRAEEWRRENE